MSAQGTIDRTPGRLVVWALICLYAYFFFLVMGLFTLSSLAALACPLLILAAIVTRLCADK